MRPVGLVPAAGQAARLGRLPCSKEILPLGVLDDPGSPVETGCTRLLRQFRLAGAEQAYVVVGHGKWDIPAFLDDGASVGVELAYLTIRDSPSTPATVDRASPFVAGRTVLFGFPDIVMRPDDAFARLLARLDDSGADAVLGLFPADRPDQVDMVEVDERGSIRRIVVKPERTELALAWVIAAWRPSFTEFLHDAVVAGLAAPGGRELYVGDVLQSAIDAGLRVEGIPFRDGAFRDVGTPEDLVSALRERW